MPSKSKKQQPKTPLSQLKNPPSPSSQSSSSSSSSRFSEYEFQQTLEQASRKFPSFISKSSLIAQISEFDTSSHNKGCRIWLSESSMLASSISPASLVSVSLPVDQNSSSAFPLKSLAVECSEQVGVDWDGNLDDKAGEYFVLATAFPSTKLVKNGVRISSTLLCSLGCPTSGRVLFVQPFHGGSLTHSNGKLHGSSVENPSICHCKELYIRLVPYKSAVALSSNPSSPSIKYTDKIVNLYENGSTSSPRTPSLERSRQCSPSPSKISSLASEDVASHLDGIKRSYFDTIEMQEILGDENSNKLLQRTAVTWLCSRALLCGNLVNVPVLSKLCLFKVVGLKYLSSDTDKDPTQTSVVQCSDEASIIDRATKITICLQSDLPPETQKKRISTSKVEPKELSLQMGDEVMKLGGLWKEYTLLRDIISASVKNALSSLGLRTTKGVLLHGPPGTGKTSLAQLCAHDAGVNLLKVNGPEIFSQYHGDSEQALHDVFKSAHEASPSVVFIDELDAIAPARKEGGEELSQRMVATLLNLMDGISRSNGLLVIAATNRVECIEPALRRPGRLDREIEIGVPSPDQRLDILTTILGKMEHSLSFAQIQQLAVATHGFVGADLAALSNEAAMLCLRRCIQSKEFICDNHSKSSIHDGSDVMMGGCCYAKDDRELFPVDHEGSSCSKNSELTVSTDSVPFPVSGEPMVTLDHKELVVESYGCSSVTEEPILKITFEDFEAARMKIRPSAMREVILEVPKVKWEDVGGQEEVKAQLMEAVEWPQKHQDAFKRIGTRPPTGVLMFGPPGCSKTLMARAVASEAGLNFLAVKGPELFSKWVGESEKAVRSLFAKARANAPSVIFFDEIDSLAVIRGSESNGVSVADRVMSQLLVELDGLHGRVNVTVIAATNRPDKIDPALLRPGRFDRLLYVGPPSETDRVDVFNVHLRKMPCSPDIDVIELAHITEGCTGADIALICREAAILAIEENLTSSEIKMEHLKNSIIHVQPSEIQPYQQLSDKFQRLVYTKSKSEDWSCQRQLNGPIKISTWKSMNWIQQLAYWLSAALSWPKSSSNRYQLLIIHQQHELLHKVARIDISPKCCCNL